MDGERVVDVRVTMTFPNSGWTSEVIAGSEGSEGVVVEGVIVEIAAAVVVVGVGLVGARVGVYDCWVP